MFKCRCARGCGLLVPGVLASMFALSSRAGAEAFETYGSFVELSVPAPGAGSFFLVGDALTDGRLIALTGLDVFVETSVGAGAFAVGASLDGALVGGGTDPAFVRVSPDGAKIAIGAGAGKPIIIVDSAMLDAAAPPLLTAGDVTVFNVEHFDAVWMDAGHLAIATSDFVSPSIVTLLDTESDPAAPDNSVILLGIGGGSGGLALLPTGELVTGNGFDIFAGGSETGTLKAFDPALWATTPADFETQGVALGELLSAANLCVDVDGNLMVGGGDFDEGDAGALGIVRAQAIQTAISSGTPFDAMDPSQVRRLDPEGSGFSFYSSICNRVTGEIVASTGTRWFRTSGAIAGDLDADCNVGASDLALLLGMWGNCPLEGACHADLEGDGNVGAGDLAMLLGSWAP